MSVGGRRYRWRFTVCNNAPGRFQLRRVSTGINNNNNRREEEEEWDVLVVLTQDGRSLRPTKWM